MPERLEDLSDEELMRLYQDANEEAFNTLYRRHSDRVYGFLRSRLSSPQAANDVFQASFLKLHRSRDQYDPSFPFAPWLFTVVRTSLLDWHKKQAIAGPVMAADENMARPAQDEPLPAVDLSSLSPTQRSVVELRYVDELSFEEIAKRLEVSPTNARQILSRSLKSLRAVFGKGGKQ